MPHAGTEAVLKTTVDPLLAKAGVALRESCKPAYAPPSLVRVVDWLHREIWDDVETELREEFLEEHGQAQKRYRELKLTAWNGPPPFWPRPHYWLRAKLLHTLEPADGNAFQVLQDPFALMIVVLKLTSMYGVNIMIQIVLFMLMDRDDEFQLVRFVLQFKGFQFFSTLFGLAYLGLKTFLIFMASAQAERLPDHGSSYDEHMALLATVAADSPGNALSFQFAAALEPVRLCLLYICLLMLVCDFTYGGTDAIHALEDVRIDAADGTLDGHHEPGHHRGFGFGRKDPQKQQGLRPHVHFSIGERRDMVAIAREKFGVQRRRGGGVLPHFLMCDAVLVIMIGVGCHFLITSNGWTFDDWITWTTLYYARLVYGLLSFPFLIFNVPALGRALHHAKPTAYDQGGALVPKLSNRDLKQMLAQQQGSHGWFHGFRPFHTEPSPAPAPVDHKAKRNGYHALEA